MSEHFELERDLLPGTQQTTYGIQVERDKYFDGRVVLRIYDRLLPTSDPSFRALGASLNARELDDLITALNYFRLVAHGKIDPEKFSE